jgi:predicted amidohydrolase
MLICMDQHYFETSRTLALKGADVVCFSTAWLDERGPAPVWITRSFENGVYAVCADRWGLERGTQFTGGSCILNPDGSIQSMADVGDTIVYGEIDLAKARDKSFPAGKEEKLAQRRPEEYMRVSLNTYLWNPLDFFGLYGRRPLPAGKKSVVTVAQFRPKRLAREENLEKISRISANARKAGTDLIVFPELATTGAVFRNTAEAGSVAEPLTGSTVKALTKTAKKEKIFIVTSLVERQGANLYNTAVLLGPKGLVGKYRKLHPGRHDKVWATPGNLGMPTFDIPGARVGLAIGHDSMFPEAFRCLAVDGADIICAPSAVEFPAPIASSGTKVPHPRPIPRGADPTHWHLWRVRAGENCAFVAFANQVGQELGATFMGRSGIFQPDLFAFPRHETVAPAEREAVRSLTIDTTNLKSDQPTNRVRVKYLLRMRQPYWYDSVVTRHPTETKAIEVVSQAVMDIN